MKTTDPMESRLPLLFSAAVYPGVGQCMQKRWGWGLVYGISFTLFVLIFFALLIRQWSEFTTAFSRAIFDGIPVDWPHFKPVWTALLICFALYISNVYDTWYAAFKKRRLKQLKGP